MCKGQNSSALAFVRIFSPKIGLAEDKVCEVKLGKEAL